MEDSVAATFTRDNSTSQLETPEKTFTEIIQHHSSRRRKKLSQTFQPHSWRHQRKHLQRQFNLTAGDTGRNFLRDNSTSQLEPLEKTFTRDNSNSQLETPEKTFTETINHHSWRCWRKISQIIQYHSWSRRRKLSQRQFNLTAGDAGENL